MKNKDLLPIEKSLEKMKGKELPLEFALFLAKNLRLIKQEIETLDETVPISTKEYREIYQPKVQKLLMEYCKRDENGDPIIKIENDNILYDFDEGNRKKIDLALKKLNDDKEIKVIIEKQDEQLKRRKELLEYDSDLVLKTVKAEFLPKIISVEVLEPLLDLIEE